METFDAIVVGTGGVGSAALYHLARRGLDVLGIDQFPQAHAHGSSHGQTRIIRQAYFEHPDYVPLLLRAYELWDEVEREVNEQLFHQVGLLEVGPGDGVLIPGVMQSAAQHNLPIEVLTSEEACEKFPFAISDQMQVVFEPTAGYLLVESCVKAHLQLAKRSGATWRQQPVVDWSTSSTGVTVRTTTDEFSADRLIICGGAWSKSLLGELGVELRVVPRHQYWFAVGDDRVKTMPTFFFELPDGYFYGFPAIDDRGMKVAKHSDGLAADGPVSLDGLQDLADETAVREFLNDHLVRRAADGNLPAGGNLKGEAPAEPIRLLSQQACMYTFSPDEHFIVDRHPQHQRVVFAAGLSGHGFKFTPVLGEALAELSCEGDSRLDLEFLRVGRFGL